MAKVSPEEQLSSAGKDSESSRTLLHSSSGRRLAACRRCTYLVAVDPPATGLTCWGFGGKTNLISPKVEVYRSNPIAVKLKAAN